MNFARYHEMLAEHGLQPFHRFPYINERTGRVEPRVLGETPRMRWRVSRDEWDRLRAHVEDVMGPYNVAARDMVARLYGWPIAPDDELPERSVIFEPDEP